MDDLLSDFLTETAEHLAAVEDGLVRWERMPDDRATLDGVFRLVHTVKGSCGFLDLPRLEALAHAAETLLGRARDGALAVTPGLVSAALAAIDGIRVSVGVLAATGKEAAGDDAALIARLARAAAGEVEPAGEATAAGAEPAKGAQTIRVSVSLLEQLMATVSELVLSRNQLLQAARGDDRLAAPLQRFSQCVAELQDGVMRTRMQPISKAWAALPRLARTLAADLGKRFELETEGGDTELDRQLLELVKDPLAHLLRNAADHGIEPPAERIVSGKAAVGRVRLSARQEGGHIVVEMADDGRGLDLPALKARAVAGGQMSAEAAAVLTPAQAARLIFLPGLSTARAVTSVSGRGVGADVVKANVEKIGGSIEVVSSPGQGARFTLRLPLTLAIVPGLIVASGGERFVIPQASVAELVRIGDDGGRIERVHDAEVLRLRGSLLPLVRLDALLGLDEVPADERFVVVAQTGSVRFGLVVDDLFNTEEIVVKPVAPLLSGLGLYGGNAVLGDGGVIMILDIGGVAAAGIAGGLANVEQEVPVAADDDEAREAMLLVRAGGGAPKALPLAAVARIEQLDAASFEVSEGRVVAQYRGDVMPLLALDPDVDLKRAGRQPVLVLIDRDRPVGLAVDAVLDIVETVLDIRLTAGVPGRVGTAVIAGRVTEVVDVAHYLRASGFEHAQPRLGPAGLQAAIAAGLAREAA